MILLFILNQLFFVLFTIYYPFYLTTHFNLKGFNPFIITFLINSPVLLFKSLIGPLFLVQDGLFNPYFNYAILMTNISSIIGFIMTVLTLRTYNNHYYFYKIVQIYTPKWRIKRNKMMLTSLIFLILFFISFLLLSRNYGLINWILNPRGGYQFGRTGSGVFFALSLLFLSTSYSIALLFCRKNKQVFPISILYLFFVWFLGSKGFLLDFCCFSFIILWARGYKNLNKIIWIGLPIIFVPLLINFGSIELEDIVKYFDYYVNSTNFYEAYFNGELDYYYGEISISSLWGLVPRALYPDKPFIYGITIINEYFFPGAAENTMTPAFGGPVAEYADFGIVGVVSASIFNWSRFFLLYCYFIIFTKFSYRKIISNPLLLFAFIYIFAPRFLQFFAFPLSLIMFIFIAKTISITNRVKLHTQ